MSPWKPALPCRQHGCPALTHDGYCPAHRAHANEPLNARPSAAARGYGWRHRKLRAYVLRRDPLCQACLRKNPPQVTPSAEAHHIIAREDGGPDTVENMEGLCKTCHSRHTARTSKAFRRRSLGKIGG